MGDKVLISVEVGGIRADDDDDSFVIFVACRSGMVGFCYCFNFLNN